MKKSIYGKLLLSFIIVFIISNVLSSMFTYFSTEVNSLDAVNTKLIENINIIKEEYSKDEISKESIETIVSDNYITVRFVETLNEYNISDENLNSINQGRTLSLNTKEHKNQYINTPIAISKIEDDYIVAIPNFDNLGFSSRSIIMSINTISIIIGSLLFLIVAKFMVNPIKDLIDATEKVTKGDFSVQLENKRQDEIGRLILSFNKMTKELNSMEMLRDNFISDISHELKTPLTSIEGYTKLLAKSDSDHIEEYSNIIIDETQRLSRLTNNILLLNKIENQNIQTEVEKFYIDEQIRKAILLLEKNWVDKNIELDIKMQKILYEGNSSLIYQIWINLLDNAIKFSSENGLLKIDLYKNEDKIIFKIKDNGMGIQEEEQDKIFEKFYKSDKSRGQDGNGLGLSIVKRILEIHNGNFKINSIVGQGTEIIIEL